MILPIALLNPVANSKDFLSRFSTSNNQASKLLKSFNLTKKLSNDLGNIYYNQPISLNLPFSDKTLKVSRQSAKS